MCCFYNQVKELWKWELLRLIIFTASLVGHIRVRTAEKAADESQGHKKTLWWPQSGSDPDTIRETSKDPTSHLLLEASGTTAVIVTLSTRPCAFWVIILSFFPHWPERPPEISWINAHSRRSGFIGNNTSICLSPAIKIPLTIYLEEAILASASRVHGVQEITKTNTGKQRRDAEISIYKISYFFKAVSLRNWVIRQFDDNPS